MPSRRLHAPPHEASDGGHEISAVSFAGMAHRPKLPIGTCAYCAASDVPVEDEHVFPDSWFPDGFPRDRMVVVPSCVACNRRYGRIEERLFWPLVAGFGSADPRTESIIARAIRGVDPGAGKGPRDVSHRAARARRLRRIYRAVPASADVDLAWTPVPRDYSVVRTPGGLLVQGAYSHEVPTEELDALAGKLVKGCYRALSGRELSRDARCFGEFFSEQPGPMLAEIANNAPLQRSGEWPFEIACTRDSRGASLWLFVLWGLYTVRGGTIPADHPLTKVLADQ